MGLLDDLFEGFEKEQRRNEIEEHNDMVLDKFSVKCPECGGKGKPAPDSEDWYDCEDCGQSFKSKPHHITYILGKGFVRRISGDGGTSATVIFPKEDE